MDVASSYTDDEFARVVEREGEAVELKTSVSGKEVQATMVALSNTRGGVIFIGVSDDRTVRGRVLDQGTDDDIHRAARDAHSVGGYVVRQVSVAGKPVVVIIVSQRGEGFAQTSDGRVLVRRGANNVPLLGGDLHSFTSSRTLRRFEATNSGVPLDGASALALDRLARAHGWNATVGDQETSSSTQMQERLTERGLLRLDGYLTISGALLLTDPARTLGAAKLSIDLRGYESDTAIDYVRRERIDGTVDQQIRVATSLVLRDLGVDLVVTGSERQEIPRLPPGAVREAVANAVAHRDYEASTSSIVIEVRPGRTIISSPGRLPEPVTVATMRQAQAPRNPSLIEALRHMGLAEDAGRGVDLIEDSFRDDFLPDPIFEEDSSHVRVTLPTGRLISVNERAWLASYRADNSLSADESLLLVHAARQEHLTNKTARQIIKRDSTESRALLQRLRGLGLLRQQGQRGGASYTLGRLDPQRTATEIVLAEARAGPLTNTRVRQILGVDRAVALAVLKSLVSDRRLVQVGERRGARYFLRE